MKKQLIYIAVILFLGMLSACKQTLDIPPKNIIGDADVFSNVGGIKAYMAALYSRMPVEDFKYATDGGTAGFNQWNCMNNLDIMTGEISNRNNTGTKRPAAGFWGAGGYDVIRYSNYILQNLPLYATTFTPDQVKAWLGEAHFVRAFTYFALVKRYGGVPIITAVQPFNIAGLSDLAVARSSEKDVYDFIAADLDTAINYMPEKSENVGRANKYVAAAFKSRVTLFAGSIARYGTPYSDIDGIMVCGIPAAQANNYFAASYAAAKLLDGKYSLYMKTWSATDKIATADNYANLFLDVPGIGLGNPNSPSAQNSEAILVKGYTDPDAIHSWDAVYSPPHLTSTYGDRFGPTLDYVELFDGLPLDAKGHLNTLNSDGTYKVFNSVGELFANCEPRLRGSVLLPGQKFKDGYVDLRRGTFIESVDPATPIIKFYPDVPTGNSMPAYTALPWYKINVKESSAWQSSQQAPILLSTGKSIYPTGLDGPTASTGATTTGFHGRKYMNPNLTIALTTLHKSTQSWIIIRYAEVLLNRAEAEIELLQNGGSVAGVDLQQDAFTCINLVRNRAGANLLVAPSDLSTDAAIAKDAGQGGYVLAPTRGLQIVRIERRKEFMVENMIYWDMKRWRTFDKEVSTRIFRKCNPFLFAKGANPVTIDYNDGKAV